jgi:hypothetical protein
VVSAAAPRLGPSGLAVCATRRRASTLAAVAPICYESDALGSCWTGSPQACGPVSAVFRRPSVTRIGSNCRSGASHGLSSGRVVGDQMLFLAVRSPPLVEAGTGAGHRNLEWPEVVHQVVPAPTMGMSLICPATTGQVSTPADVRGPNVSGWSTRRGIGRYSRTSTASAAELSWRRFPSSRPAPGRYERSP